MGIDVKGADVLSNMRMGPIKYVSFGTTKNIIKIPLLDHSRSAIDV